MGSTKRVETNNLDHNERIHSGDIRPGDQCLFNVTGRHFLVRVLETDSATVRITFPGIDYPVEGMRAYLEFHDETGFYYYPAEILRGPMADQQGVLLSRPTELKRSTHRSSCRVATDLTVRVKDQVHVRRYDAALINISSGGALLQTEAPLDFSSTVEITLSLPGETSHLILGQVVHIIEPAPNAPASEQMIGIKFSNFDPVVEKSLTRYIWRRLQELYPQD